MFMVMSAIEYANGDYNSERCYSENLCNILSMETAEILAARRTEVEREAGHNNVTWFACEQF